MMDKGNYRHSESFDCFVTNSVGIDLIVFECGYEKCDPFHCWGPEKKQAHFFHYVISGKGRLFIGDKRYECKGGDLFYLSPNEMAYYEADGGNPWEYKWVGFTGVRAASLIGNTTFPKNPIRHNVDGTVVQKYLDNIFSSFRSEQTPDLLAVGHLYLFLAWILQQYSTREFTKEYVNEKRFYDMIRFIQLKYTTKLRISDIAESLNYDRTYIYKLFMKYVHMSPSDYIEALRMKLAAELIRSKKFTLAEVSSRCGYDNYNWFFTVFKRTYNITPMEFEKSPELEHLEPLDKKYNVIDHIFERYQKFVKEGKFL